jgi:tryptophan-rich sensory protein
MFAAQNPNVLVVTVKVIAFKVAVAAILFKASSLSLSPTASFLLIPSLIWSNVSLPRDRRNSSVRRSL